MLHEILMIFGIILTLLMGYEDAITRWVSTWQLCILFILGCVDGVYLQDITRCVSILLVILIVAIISVYFILKGQKKIFDEVIGWGDIVGWFAFATWFGPICFLYFMIGTCMLAIGGYFVWYKSSNTTIPLFVYMSASFMCTHLFIYLYS